MDYYPSSLQADTAQKRLAALKEIKKKIDSGEIKKSSESNSVNNHIHTLFSFSPYSPSAAVYMAWQNGLCTAGMMDHDSIGGAKEFIEAGKILGIATTVGLECRVNMDSTRLAGKKINNPDQNSIAYVALHGLRHDCIETVQAYFAPYREARNQRNRIMCDNITTLLSKTGIRLDFDTDVLPFSEYERGGTVTERHILFSLAKKLDTRFPQRDALCAFLEQALGIPMREKTKTNLLNAPDAYYLYDLLGLLKVNLVEQFYVPATEECPSVQDFIALCKQVGAISAYAYLGDVGDSVTGDKKAQHFEDRYLDLLFEELSALGFNAVTYMPTRNTQTQLAVVMDYCRKYALFQISGEVINSPRQSFVCKALEKPAYTHLYAATYALIGHEKMVSQDSSHGMFSEKTLEMMPDLYHRIAYFEAIGRAEGGEYGILSCN